MSHLTGISYQVWSEQPTMNNKGTPTTQDNSKGLGVPSRKWGTKASQIIYYILLYTEVHL